MLKLRRGEGRFFKPARAAVRVLMRSNLPIPSLLRPVYGLFYDSIFGVRYASRWALNYFLLEPAFRSRCTKVGRNLHMWSLPDITTHTRVYIGDNVSMYGHFGVGSGRIFADPTLIIGNNVDLGHNVAIIVNKRVVIEDCVNIASEVRIVDSDGHPRDAHLRAAKCPPSPDEIKPVRICKHAWIGQGSYIMKGVTIGEGAIIGANSVVVSDIPPFSVAFGNPARIIVKDTRTRPEAAMPNVSTVYVGGSKEGQRD